MGAAHGYGCGVDRHRPVAAGGGGGGAAPDPSYGNDYARGARDVAPVTISTTASTSMGALNNLVDGDYRNGTGTSWAWTNGQSGKEIKFDFGVGIKKRITEAKWYQDIAGNHGTWKWQGSDNDADWTDIGSTFTLGGTAQTHTQLNGNATAYRYYRLLQTAGTTNDNPWLHEIEFEIGDGTAIDATPEFWKVGGSGDRRTYVTITSTITKGGGNLNELIDGRVDLENYFFNAGQSGREIKFNFGVGASKIITEINWRQSNGSSHGTWKLQGSDNDADWTDIGGTFTLGSSGNQTITTPSANTTGYRYYRLLQTAGTTSTSPWVKECRFKIANAAA